MRSYSVLRYGVSGDGVGFFQMSSSAFGLLLASRREGIFCLLLEDGGLEGCLDVRSSSSLGYIFCLLLEDGGLDGCLSDRASSSLEGIFCPAEGVLGPGFVLASRRYELLIFTLMFSSS